MEYPDEYRGHAEGLECSQLKSGIVLFVALALMNILMLLNWLGVISLA